MNGGIRMTAIEWTHAPGFKGETWNPVVGCSVVSPGCTHCYAMRQAARLLDGNRATPHYAGTTRLTKAGPVWTGKIALAPDAIMTKPLRWKAPRMVFVNSMGDLFHESVPDDWIDRVFAVMALAPQHIFLVLTKRSARMRNYVIHVYETDEGVERLSEAAVAVSGSPCAAHVEDVTHPLPNVWLGVSAEDQTRADERIPDLLDTPAAKRFISAEPLLAPIDFSAVHFGDRFYANTLLANTTPDAGAPKWPALDWIITGGESGPGARPASIEWFRSIRDQCANYGVPYFHKQNGEFIDSDDFLRRVSRDGACDAWGMRWRADKALNFMEAESLAAQSGYEFEMHSDGTTSLRVGKKEAGAMIDGRKHREWPL